MRTRVKGVKTVGLGLKRLATFMIAASIMVSCGKNNTSGTTTDISDNWNIGGGVYGGGNGNQLPSNWMDVVSRENPCYFGGTQRSQAQIQINANVNVGAVYVGVTSYGDIAIVQNQGGVPTMKMYICQRAGLTGQGQVMNQNQVVENSQYCPLGQISDIDVMLGAQNQNHYSGWNTPTNNPYQLAFRPIHIPGTGVQSSLCSNQYYY